MNLKERKRIERKLLAHSEIKKDLTVNENHMFTLREWVNHQEGLSVNENHIFTLIWVSESGCVLPILN
jgi:hypothetical protein